MNVHRDICATCRCKPPEPPRPLKPPPIVKGRFGLTAPERLGLVFALGADGLTDVAVGRLLGLTPPTVRKLRIRAHARIARAADKRFPIPGPQPDWSNYLPPEPPSPYLYRY